MLDLEIGSKVLDFYFPVVWIITPLHPPCRKITKACRWIDFEDSDEAAPIWGDFCEFHCKIRFSLYAWENDPFSITVNCTVLNTEDGQSYQINGLMRPIEFSNCHETLEDGVEKNSLILNDQNKTYTVEVALETQAHNGFWHSISADLQKIIRKANAKATLIDLETVVHDPTSSIKPADRTSINSVTIAGYKYRMDDILFTKPGALVIDNATPHLFKIGPIYGQMGDVKTFWVTAEDTDLGMSLFLNNKGVYEFSHIVGQVNGIDRKATFDLSGKGGSLKNLDIADAADMGSVIIKSDDPDDSDGIIDAEDANLNFQFTIGDTLGSCSFLMAKPISCIPEGENNEAPEGTWPFSQSKTDLFPPYLLQENGVIIPNLPSTSKGDEDDGAVYLRSMTNPIYVLAVALYNSGHEIFPNVRALIIHHLKKSPKTSL